MAQKEKKESRQKKTGTRRSAMLTGLVLCLTALSACSHGSASSKIAVTEEYLDQLIEELPEIEKCCPAAMMAIDDWIVQNEPA